MVEFIHQPWKRVIIHELIHSNLDMITEMNVLGVQPGQLGRPIQWADGIAFVQSFMPPTEDIVKEQLQGRVHWAFLMFTFMPNYQQLVNIPEGNIRIPIINLSSNPLFKEMAKWLKNQFSL